jgi:hypothetical protein
MKSFSIDYLRQTNLLLGEGTNVENAPDFSGIENAFSGLLPVPMMAAPVEEKKERKKRSHDPNAPKRPLTPYFLYMQTARPIIASDLGEDAPKGAVQEEGQRRWAVMGAAEKQGWNQAYQYNLRLYNARVHSYKHGNANAKNMTDEEAGKYADDFSIELPAAAAIEEPVGNEQDAIAEQLQQTAPAEEPAAEEEEEEEEEAAPAAKTPKKGKETRKRKTATPAVEPEAPKPSAPPASPDRKRKRTSKAAEVEEPKKSGRKKAKSG